MTPYDAFVRFLMHLRIYYEDTDAGGVVYHANYLGFFERARTEFFRLRGLSVKQLHDDGFIFPVVRVEVDFKAPAVLDDLLRIDTTLLETGRTSFTLQQQVIRQEDEKLLVAAKITLVCVAPGMKAKRLPLPLLEALNTTRD